MALNMKRGKGKAKYRQINCFAAILASCVTNSNCFPVN